MRPPGLPDDYTPVEHLASGGQADVWRVSRRTDGTSWVAKLYHSADPAHLGEAVALSRLSHPAFPRIHGVSLTAGETHCLLIEHIPGETLDAWAAQHRGSPTFATKATHVLTHLAAALAALHELDIAHRDLTPANVLLLPTFDGDPKRPGGLKLIDLGIATAVHEQTRAGTRPFRAPESFVRDASAGTGAQADVFAWGVLAVWLFSGRFPTGLSADASEDELRARYRDDVPLADGLVSVPTKWRGVVQGALRRSPRDRIASGSRLGESLRATEQPNTELGPAEPLAPAPPVQAPVEAATVAVQKPSPAAAVSKRGKSGRTLALMACGAFLLGVATSVMALLHADEARWCSAEFLPDALRERGCEFAIGRGSYLDIGRARRLHELVLIEERLGDMQEARLLAAEGVGACAGNLCANVGPKLLLDLDRLCRAERGAPLEGGWAWGVVTAREAPEGAAFWTKDHSRKLSGVPRGRCVMTRHLELSQDAQARPTWWETKVGAQDGRMDVLMIAPLAR